jgi:DNA modification methylase
MIQLIETSKYHGRDLSVFCQNMSLPRHRWYEFKEGFSEGLVAEAIQETATRSRVLRILDPFCGSGTTLVAAGRLGHAATGIEVNPFLAFAASAKTTPGGWRSVSFRRHLEQALSTATHEVRSPLEGLSTFTGRASLTKWLFNRSVLRGFTALDQALHAAGRYRPAMRLALFASVMDCCNARRDGKCLRYVREWEKQGYDSARLRNIFRSRCEQIADDVTSNEFHHDGLRVIRGDARSELQALRSGAFDLVVTSPPYLNSFDYSDVYRPELFLGGFVRDNTDLRRLRLQTIRSHVQVNWEASSAITSTMLPPLLQSLRDRTLWDRRIPAMIQSYFADMASVMKECARVVRRGGNAWIVVSTSAYGGIEIPVDLILADIASRNGWQLDGVFVLRYLRSAGQHWAHIAAKSGCPLRESLLVLKKM